MRKLKEDEIKRAAATFADIFKEYEAYRYLFPHKTLRQKRMYYSFIYELYAGLDYTYVYDEDFSAIATVKKPSDVERDTRDLWKNPIFAVKMFLYEGAGAIRRAQAYMNFADVYAQKYFNPETDCYVKNIGVVSSARGKGILRRVIDETCGDMPVFLETHDENNVKIYEHLGFEALEAVPYANYTHYVMKRAGKAK